MLQRAAKRPGHLQRLVVAALAQALPVQAHRHQRLRARQTRTAPGHQVAEQAARRQILMEFESPQQPVHRPAIGEAGMHPLQRWWFLQALPAQRHPIGGEQLGGAAQAGMAMIRQGGATRGAQIDIRRTGLCADQTQARQQQPQQPLRPPVNRSNLSKVDSLFHAHQTAWLTSR
ncbi:hypothetical protein A11M_0108370 [Xanthomonas vasicola pv. vasculorum NCPPB 895]|nr:hypothetical protein A11M_0108370 [Xanthomonas vasicola pv. vasculorum NCPPB 895]